MACSNTNNEDNTPKCGTNRGSNINYIIIIVLYILLAIILGAVIY